MKWKQELIKGFLFVCKLLWPDTCPFCGSVHKGGVCPECAGKTSRLRVREPRCMQCGKPVRQAQAEYCRDCMQTHHHYDRGVSLWLHKIPVSTSIYRFKYKNQRSYGSYYAKQLADQCGAQIKAWNPGLIIPIPLYPARKRNRGFNQAEVIARALGDILHIPTDGTSLKRVKQTVPQKMLGHRKRRRNLYQAFALAPQNRLPAAVLLVDDIYTTGNTIDAAARVLKEEGVENVYFLTISIGQGY